MTIGFLIMTVFFLQEDQLGAHWRARQFCVCHCLSSYNSVFPEWIWVLVAEEGGGKD